jgi:hypothetical protein
MAYRGMIDGDQHPNAAKMAKRIPAIMKQNWIAGLTLDAAEQRFVSAPFGTLKQQERIETSWLIERMAVLAWAIGAAELPPFYLRVNGANVSSTLGMFQPGAEEKIENARLRDPEEILMGARTYAALTWRLTEYVRDSTPIDFYQKIKDPESHHLTVDGLEFCDSDLAVEGVPLRKVEDALLRLTCAIVYQRNRQFRWLLGFERGESVVPTVN